MIIRDILGDGERAAMGQRIRDKVQAALTLGIESEVQLVYFLVQLRKRIEQSGGTGRGNAKFFCDWALHPTMSRAPARSVLAEVDQALDTCKVPEELGARLGPRLSMEAFREDLIHELMKHRLPVGPIREKQPWLGFLRLYLSLVADSPLLDYTINLRNIDRLSVRLDHTSTADVPKGTLFAFTIAWTFMKQREVVFHWNNEMVYVAEQRAGASNPLLI